MNAVDLKDKESGYFHGSENVCSCVNLIEDLPYDHNTKYFGACFLDVQ